jgi:site-specific DNA-methyltransferase (adenine-specific)
MLFVDLLSIELGDGAYIQHVRWFTIDTVNVGNGLDMLRCVATGSVTLAVFDPQSRASLDHQDYGNEGKSRGRRRHELRQQSIEEIVEFGRELHRVLRPSGYVARWTTTHEEGKALEGKAPFVIEGLQPCAKLTWNSGLPSYPKRVQERGSTMWFMQKPPHGIKAQRLPVKWLGSLPWVHREAIPHPKSWFTHTHTKPFGLTTMVIEAITREGDTVLDATAGSHTVLAAALAIGRHCWSTDVAPWPPQAPESSRLPE